MFIAPTPDSADARLRALRQLEILDTEAEVQFDALAKAASLVCGVPISLVSLIDLDRQWSKANIGLEQTQETSRHIALCSHAILQDDLFKVPDALADERFHDNPLVTDDPYIRFCAGVPLVSTGGAHVGTLYVIDREPRILNPQQRQILVHLAKVISHVLEIRRITRNAEHSAA